MKLRWKREPCNDPNCYCADRGNHKTLQYLDGSTWVDVPEVVTFYDKEDQEQGD